MENHWAMKAYYLIGIATERNDDTGATTLEWAHGSWW